MNLAIAVFFLIDKKKKITKKTQKSESSLQGCLPGKESNVFFLWGPKILLQFWVVGAFF